MDKNSLEFVVFCIESTADELNMSGNIIYKMLTEDSHILFEYIVPNYGVLHTLSKEYIVNDIIDYMREEGIYG